MATTASAAALVVLVLLALVSPSVAFNITRILGEFSDFSTFNDLLSQNKLADEINRRQTITVLAVDNGAAGALSSLPSDVQRKVLAVHVVLDYYDAAKLGAMKNRSAMLTTLFQSTGQAANRMGFLNCTKRADGVMVFGSAEPGAPVTSQMVKTLVSRPYNISVLQVSSAIVPPSIGSADNSKAAAPPPAPAKATPPAPTPSKGRKAAPPPKTLAPAPAPAEDASADAPAAADAPGPAADSPTADGPAEADAPAHERSSDDAADAPEGSGACRVVAGAVIGAVTLAITMVSL